MKVKRALFFARISVFIVMALWAIDKLINPEHAGKVFEKFYFMKGLGSEVFFVIGIAQLAIYVGFLLGAKKNITYMLVLIMHGLSTLSTYQQLANPFEARNMLFLAALPMLAACYFLWTMREQDTLFNI